MLNRHLVLIRPNSFFRRPKGRVGYRVAISFCIFTWILYILLHLHHWDGPLQRLILQGFTQNIGLAGILFIVAEEIVFRGFLQSFLLRWSALRQKPFRLYWCIYVQAVVFWILHAPFNLDVWKNAIAQGVLPIGFGSFFLGLVCGWMAWKDRSLYWAIGFHFAANLLGPVWLQMSPSLASFWRLGLGPAFYGL